MLVKIIARAFCLILIVQLLLPALVLAETIILKSGKKIEGRIIEKTDEYVKIELSGIPLTYYQEQIDSISQQSIEEMEFMPRLIKLYTRFSKTVDKGGWEAVKKYLTQARIKELEKMVRQLGGRQNAIGVLKAITPRELKDLKGEKDDYKVMLSGTGVDLNDLPVSVNITFQKEAGQWKVGRVVQRHSPQ